MFFLQLYSWKENLVAKITKVSKENQGNRSNEKK